MLSSGQHSPPAITWQSKYQSQKHKENLQSDPSNVGMQVAGTACRQTGRTAVSMVPCAPAPVNMAGLQSSPSTDHGTTTHSSQCPPPHGVHTGHTGSSLILQCQQKVRRTCQQSGRASVTPATRAEACGSQDPGRPRSRGVECCTGVGASGTWEAWGGG